MISEDHARDLMNDIRLAWQSRNPRAVTNNYASEAVIIYAGQLVFQGSAANLQDWATALLASRRDIKLDLRFRAFTVPYLCYEYVSTFLDASDNATVLAGAEVLELSPQCQIARQHIYPASIADDSPLLG